MRAGLTADASFFAFVLPLLVQGIAMGTFFVAMITILLDGVPPERMPSASGCLELRAHHRRRLRHLDHDHLLGSARGAASDAAGGEFERLQSQACRTQSMVCRRSA